VFVSLLFLPEIINFQSGTHIHHEKAHETTKINFSHNSRQISSPKRIWKVPKHSRETARSASELVGMAYLISVIVMQNYLSATNNSPPSVAVTRAGVFANLWNKIGKILKIFERLDYLRGRWVLC
jgi:hypothetical protein